MTIHSGLDLTVPMFAPCLLGCPGTPRQHAASVFVVVAAAVSAVVGLAARRTRDAARAGADAEVLFNLAGNVLRGEHALDALLDRLRETFGQESVTLLEYRPGTPLN